MRRLHTIHFPLLGAGARGVAHALGLVAALLAIPAWSATYYISPTGSNTTGDGSTANPWATIDYPGKQNLLLPGDTVAVGAGTYPQANGQGVVLSHTGGTQAAPIKYLANGKVLIDQSPFSGATCGFQVRAPYITLSGFEIKGAAHGIVLDGSAPLNGNYCVVTNCVIHDSGPVNASGIYLKSCQGALVIRNAIYNVNSGADTPWSVVGAGIRVSGGGATTNRVWNNTVDNAYIGVFYYGVNLGDTAFGRVSALNNIVVNAKGWGFVNPWCTDPSFFQSGYNLAFADAIAYGNFPAGNNGPLPTDVAADPKFVFDAIHDYRLLTNSPAINAGANLGYPYIGVAPDMGAYEGGNAPLPLGVVAGKVAATLLGAPGIPGATVQTIDGTLSAVTDLGGSYSLVVPSGAITLKATGAFLNTHTQSTNVAFGTTVTLNFTLNLTNSPKTNYVDTTVGDDSYPGTIQQPWKTIANGDAKSLVSPGDMVIVNTGTYHPATAQGVVLSNRFGYGFAPIRYQAQGPVVIDQTAVSGPSSGFRISVRGVALSGFEIIGAQHGISILPGADSCSVDSCVIHDANGAGQDCSGIYVNQAAGLSLSRNVIYNINSSANTAWSPLGAAIRDQGADNLKVLNNTIDNAYVGVFYYGGGGPSAGPYGTITSENNIVVNCGGWGFANPWNTDGGKFVSGFNLVFGDVIAFGNYPAGNNAPTATDIAADPRFVNRLARNYQLQNTSPALNMGIDVGLPYSGLAPDLGALESSYSPPPATYYVDGSTGNDSNPGTQALPWKSIANGDAKGLLNPGDTVLVNPGIYSLTDANGVKLSLRRGAPTAPITYRADGAVLLRQTSAQAGNCGFNLGVMGIRLQGFEITNAANGIYIAPGCGYCSVDSCRIHDTVNPGGGDVAGIYVNQAANVTLSRNLIYNINAGADTPWSPLGAGVRCGYADNLKVLNNTIDNAWVGVYYYGQAPGGSPYGSITTENNIVVNCKGWGFVNPWLNNPAFFTHGYNLTFNDAIAYGNFPAGNNAPTATDIAGQDPLFLNPAAGNYYLQADSPAIAAGVDVGLPFVGPAPSLGAFDPPFVISQAPHAWLTAGAPAILSASVSGAEPYVLQWFRNGVPIPGATGPDYVLSSPSPCDNNAVYSLQASNVFGVVSNSGTILTVVQPIALGMVRLPPAQGANPAARLTLTAQAGRWFWLEMSDDLETWQPLEKVFNANGTVARTEDLSNAASARFFRARLAAPEPAFSFTYNSLSSKQLLGAWNSNRTEIVLDASRRQMTTTFSDPVSGLNVTCQAIEHVDFPAAEWVLFFENQGTADTPLLEAVNAAELLFTRGGCGEFVLRTADGCSAVPTDFQPREFELSPFSLSNFAPAGGRSSQDTAFPYFNLCQPEGGGTILAVGWSGQWKASFARDGVSNVVTRAGMELTHLVLHPGERIRTPSILTLAYPGDWLAGQNLFRKLMLDRYSPTPDGRPLATPLAASPHSYIALGSTSESNMLRTITNIVYNRFPVNAYWIDAGWFYYDTIWEFGGGNWFPDPARYPRGMKPVADAAHANGMKFLLWFDPERVMPNTALYNNHANWLLTGDVVMGGRPCYLLDLGNPAALNWAKTNFSAMIAEIGIDIYRLDFNMPPLNYWRNRDSSVRQGITEIGHITGLYDFLDSLLRDHPSLLIDNSSAAGHRLDFEMARRAIPLTRSDYGAPVGSQCMEYGLSLWLPYQGLGSDSVDPYAFRSGMGATAVYFFPGFGNPNDPSWAIGAQMVEAYKTVKPFYTGDFYPLTPYSTNEVDWLAYQFHRPDLDGGVVHAFARNAAGGSKLIKLRALDPAARYALTNFDSPGVTEAPGADLMNQGIRLRTPSQPGAIVLVYRKTAL